MRQLSWHVFSKTGNVESYLLYKEMSQEGDESALPEDEIYSEENESLIH
ncbi:YqzL family protein [Salipaludibacillus sp. CUR1]|nr:YqzL family protein [Salipaludibacillus sp. CUR1]MCE7794216.1 YqzL family protein [Salipaludibacillus sp. CUR1]